MNILYIVSPLIFIADRITKQIAVLCAETAYVINKYLSFELVLNRGVSWSMFHSDDTWVFGLVTFVVIIIAVLLAYYTYTRYRTGHAVIGESLILAGASSNIIDRCVYHGVIDFIVLGADGWTFPVFNVADVSIIIGVILMLWTHARDL